MCDSALIVCSGDMQPPGNLRSLWGAMIGSVTGLLLLASGLPALQVASTAVSLPFSLVHLALMAELTPVAMADRAAEFTGVRLSLAQAG